MGGLTQKQAEEIREELQSCQRPLFFFHDDPDGFASFLLLYRYVKEGSGVVVKSHPCVDAKFLSKVKTLEPDKIFIVDIALLDEEFVSSVKLPIIWIDHHEPHKIGGVKVYNPRIAKKDNNIPASCLCYEVVKQDLWIAAVGAVGDWFIPDFLDEFAEQNPTLVEKGITDPPKVMFDTKLGVLIKLFSFVLKGKTEDALKSAKILTRITSPYEILDQLTPQGKYLYKRFAKINKKYEELLESAKKVCNKDDPLLLYTYSSKDMSFTGDLANELLYRFPDKLILIAREKSGEMRYSLRNSGKVNLPQLIQKALVGVEGYGGGHEHACGGSIKIIDFDRFIENLKDLI